MSRLMVASLLTMWGGWTVLLSEVGWFRRLPLVDRLVPFVPGGSRARREVVADRSLRDVLGPMAAEVGGRLARAFGAGEELSLRLERVGSALTPTQFRTRQAVVTAGTVVVGAAVALLLPLPAVLVALVVLGLPLLAFLVVEQRLSSAAARHQKQVFAELPVVAEQLGMLISAGLSLTGALSRTSERSSGACASDLRRVCVRIGQGVGVSQALNEWADTAGSPEVARLVNVLVLHEQTTDLGVLISAEARSVRREAHRRLLERIERRSEQVWIPVTVATLVPGVIFLSIPFTDALRDFGAL